MSHYYQNNATKHLRQIFSANTVSAEFSKFACSDMGKITEGRIAETWDTCLTCQLCSRKFYSVAGFRSHLSQMHPKEWIEETRYSCLNCKKLFRSTELKQHYETAHFDQYNKCEFCDKLIKKGYLARHQRTKCRFITPLKH